MTKKDLLACFIIAEVSSLIFLGILRFLELPEIVLRLAKFVPLVAPVLAILGIYFAQLLSKKFLVLFQFAKSYLVGILNSFIDLGILNLLMWFSGMTAGLLYSVFKGFSFACATVNSYFWNKFWAFSSSAQGFGGQGKKMVGKEFLQFFLVAGTGFTIHLIVASLLVNVVGPQFGLSEKLWANLGAVIAIFFGFSWNFFGYKFIVFKK